ncbi:MAG: hypothetical protein INR71_15430 [Terriglobus roseus]|nr:hypothetical protein [Terriglobus roseus]
MMADEKKRDDNIGIQIDDRRADAAASIAAEAQKAGDMAAHGGVTNSPVIAVLSYCGSSILMTTTNKYVLSGVDFNLSFFLLCVQVRCPPVCFLASAEVGMWEN